MQLACVEAIANIARSASTDEIESVYKGEELQFGPSYLIPKPFDARLFADVSFAAATAAIESGVALRPITDLDAYRKKLHAFSNRTLMFMQPVIELARHDRERVVYAEGENRTVLRTVQAVVRERIAEPIVIGRRGVVERRLTQLGIDLKAGDDFELIDPEDDARYREYLGVLPFGNVPAWRIGRCCSHHHPYQYNCDSSLHGRQGRSRCHDLRCGRPLRSPPAGYY